MSHQSPVTGIESKALTLRNFGGLSLENGGRPIVGAANQPARLVMLSVIAGSGERGISRERLMALFWPDSDTERARSALNTALYALRRDVAEQELTIGTAVIRLNPAIIGTDVDSFERAIETGDHRAAVQLYRGPFLDGVHIDAGQDLDEWIEQRREELARRYAQALEALAKAAEATADHVGAVDWWRRLAALDPLNSATAYGLVRSMASAGDRAGAVQYAERHQAALKSELDLPPDRELATFIASLRRPGPPIRIAPIAAEAAPASGTAPVPEPAPHRPRRGSLLTITFVAAILIGIGVIALRRSDDYGIGRATQLTFEQGLEIEPALSSDGSLLAYAAGPLSLTRIYVRQRGGQPVRVTPDSGPGQRRPVWSPDGTRLLFLLGRYQPSDLAVTPALGGVTPRIVARSVMSAAWAPDGRRIAYVRDDSLYVMALDSGHARAILGHRDMFALAWSPDGRFIAFAAGNSKFATSENFDFGNIGPSAVFIVAAAGGEPVAITDGGALNVSPVWTPDSRRLLFVSNRDGPRDIYATRISESGQRVGSAARLTVGLSAHSISLSADGRRLAWSLFIQRSNIWSRPIDTTGARRPFATPVTTGSQLLEGVYVSADGRRLYYNSDREGNADVYRLTLPAGAEAVALTTHAADDFGGDESRDGREIVFWSTRHGNRDIFVMSASGGEPERVTTGTEQELIARWSPDGRSIAYAVQYTPERSGLYVVSRDDQGRWGEPRKLSTIPNEPEWSPDGRTMVVSWDPGVLWLVSVDGSPARRIYAPRPGTTDPGLEVARFLPDGRTLLAKSHDVQGAAYFWLLPAAGGTPRLIGRVDDLTRPSPRDELATDGRRLYYVVIDRSSDIYLADISGVR